MTTCLFCRIVSGDIPSRQVYADDHAVAFLDIAPWHRGHTLVVPRRHVSTLADDPSVLADCQPAIEHLVGTLTSRLGADGMNVLVNVGEVAGQEVFHVHVHLVPRYGSLPGLPGLAQRDASADDLDEVLAQVLAS